MSDRAWTGVLPARFVLHDHRKHWLAASLVTVAAAVSSAVPAQRGNAHAGTADGSRPVVTSVDPALPGPPHQGCHSAPSKPSFIRCFDERCMC